MRLKFGLLKSSSAESQSFSWKITESQGLTGLLVRTLSIVWGWPWAMVMSPRNLVAEASLITAWLKRKSPRSRSVRKAIDWSVCSSLEDKMSYSWRSHRKEVKIKQLLTLLSRMGKAWLAVKQEFQANFSLACASLSWNDDSGTK